MNEILQNSNNFKLFSLLLNKINPVNSVQLVY